jgi:hypothetical protein
MATVSPESIPIALGQEDDGRWWADVESMPDCQEDRIEP